MPAIPDEFENTNCTLQSGITTQLLMVIQIGKPGRYGENTLTAIRFTLVRGSTSFARIVYKPGSRRTQFETIISCPQQFNPADASDISAAEIELDVVFSSLRLRVQTTTGGALLFLL